MSIQAIAYVLEHSRSEHSARLVLLSIANHTNDEGVAYASVATYARETRLGERTVQTALRDLESQAEIERAGEHPQLRTFIYRMLFPCLQLSLDEGAVSAPPQDLHPAETGQDSAPEPTTSSGVRSSSTASTVSVLTSARQEAERMFGEDFWPRYPRKVSKRAALRAFKAALKRAPLDSILDGLEAALPEFSKRDADKVPYPATWLNADGWADEHPEPVDAIAAHVERMQRSRTG